MADQQKEVFRNGFLITVSYFPSDLEAAEESEKLLCFIAGGPPKLTDIDVNTLSCTYMFTRLNFNAAILLKRKLNHRCPHWVVTIREQ